MSDLSDAVKNDVVKKLVYDQLAAKVSNIDTSTFILKTKYQILGFEKKNPDTSGLVKKTDCNTKLTELENKILDVSNLPTKTVLTAGENKISPVLAV